MSYTCPRCGRTSHHPTDERYAYCAACGTYAGVTPLADLLAELELVDARPHRRRMAALLAAGAALAVALAALVAAGRWWAALALWAAGIAALAVLWHRGHT